MGKTVVVAGAGPVGALAAIFLAQRGYDVKVGCLCREDLCAPGAGSPWRSDIDRIS